MACACAVLESLLSKPTIPVDDDEPLDVAELPALRLPQCRVPGARSGPIALERLGKAFEAIATRLSD